MKPRLTLIRRAAIALSFFGSFSAMMPSPARAQETGTQKVISPLRVEPDRNGVNLTNGKINLDVPTLSVPGASRLRFDRVQNSAPYVLGKVNIASGTQYLTGNYSVHSGAEASESFTCDQEIGCTSVTLSGSAYITNFLGLNRYRRAPGGEEYLFNLKHSESTQPATISRPGIRTLLYYASKITYPDGEVITFTYNTGAIPGDTFNRTFYRPITVSSSTGYYISIAYQYTGTDVSVAGWGTPGVAALYSASDPANPIQRLTYSGNTITDLAGRVYTVTGANNALGNNVETTVGSVQLPTEAANSLIINQSPSYPLVGSVVHDGVSWSYGYTNVVNHTGASDPSYDKITVTGPNGYSMAYDMAGHIAASGWRNFIVKQTDALGRATNFVYDGGYRVTKITLPEGNAVAIGYDDCGNIASKVSKAKVGSGLTDLAETAGYPAAGPPENLCPNVLSYRPILYRDALNRQTDYVYNSLGQMTEQLEPANASGVRRKTIVTYANSAAGISRKTSVRVCGATTTCAGFADSRTDFTYVGNTLLPLTVSQVDEASGAMRVTTYTYDSAGRVLSTDGPLTGTAVTQYFRYDVLGRKAWEIGALAPNGLRLAKSFTYRDSDDKVTAVESGTLTSPTDTNLVLLDRSDMVYDSRRYAIRETASAGGTAYSVTDRSTLDRGLPDCTTVRMNLAALPAASATGACSLGTQGGNGPDRITRNLYDNGAQLLKVQKAFGVPAEQADYVSYTYTLNGKQQYVTDANGIKAELKYDGFDRQSHWYFPSKTTVGVVSTTDFEQYSYDAAGNRTSLRRRDGRTLTFAYDGLNRLTSKLVPDGCAPIQIGPCTPASATRDVFYGYDLMGQQLTAKFDSQTGADGITNTYNAFGDLLSSTAAMSGFSKTLTNLYDEAGRRTRLTHADGQAFTYAYDALDRLSGVYEGVGTATALATFGYNNRGLTQARTERLGSSAAYTYDPIGRLAAQTDAFVGGINNVGWNFTHNPASQIASETRDNDAYAFAGLTPVNRAYAVNGLNQYSSVAGTALTYDANGNLIGDGVSAYVYDGENRLVSATASGTTATLTYDPLGRSWQLVKGTANTRFLTDGDAMVSEYDAAGTMTARYVHGSNAAADDPLVWYPGATLTGERWLHSNHQGSVVAITDVNGGNPSINTYDEYGVPGAGNTGRFQYTGQAWLAELGLYYYKARFYSPALGRFLQTDPVGYEGGINIYAYVGNDPVNAGDPSGLAAIESNTCSRLGSSACSGVYDGDKTGGSAKAAGNVGQKSITNGIISRGRGASDELIDQIVTSYQLGLYGEDYVTDVIEKEGYTILDRNVYLWTVDAKLRIVDIAAIKDGTLYLIEVKVNNSRYTSAQREKDNSIAKSGAWINPRSQAAKDFFGFVGLGRPYIDPTPIHLIRINCSYAGWICRK